MSHRCRGKVLARGAYSCSASETVLGEDIRVGARGHDLAVSTFHQTKVAGSFRNRRDVFGPRGMVVGDRRLWERKAPSSQQAAGLQGEPCWAAGCLTDTYVTCLICKYVYISLHILEILLSILQHTVNKSMCIYI